MSFPKHNIINFTTDLVPKAMQLVKQAGWNQTDRDWQRLLDYQPHGSFACTIGEQLAGTVTTICYGRDLAWIGMMLVDTEHRRQGIGRALMVRAIEYLREQQVQCVRLDATPLGQPLYEKLGFETEFNFSRYIRVADPVAAPNDFATSETTETHNFVVKDQKYFGADRSQWLSLLSRDSRVIQQDECYGMLRAGRLANYLGPIIASPENAGNLIRELLSQRGESTYWDVPSPNQHAIALAQQYGFEPARSIARMRLGPSCPCDYSRQYAIADLSTG